jgi:hypothetical protein
MRQSWLLSSDSMNRVDLGLLTLWFAVMVVNGTDKQVTE